jgi:hypothetical protein
MIARGVICLLTKPFKTVALILETAVKHQPLIRWYDQLLQRLDGNACKDL